MQRGNWGDPGWWMGFMCGHVGDHKPGMAGLSVANLPYRDISYAEDQVRRLAGQVALARNSVRNHGAGAVRYWLRRYYRTKKGYGK